MQPFKRSYRIRNSNPIHTHFIDSTINREEINQVGSERILRRKSHFNPFAFDKLNHFNRSFVNVIHIFPVGMFSQEGRSANDNIDAVNTCFHCNPRIIHVTADVCQNFSFQT